MAEVMKAPNKTVAVVPDTREIDQKALSAVDSARELSIKDQKQYAHAADFLQGLKTIEKAIDETFDPVIKAAFDAHKAALAAKGKHLDPVKEAEKIVKFKMIGFQKEEEQRIKVEETRLREAARQQEEEDRCRRAEELIAAGRPEDALVLLEGNTEPMPIVLHETSAPRLKGIVTRTVWKFRVVDEAKIPCAYHTVDLQKIRRVVQSTEGKIEVPGIEIYQEKEIAAGGIR